MRNHRSTNGENWITITEGELLIPNLISLMPTKINKIRAPHWQYVQWNPNAYREEKVCNEK